MFSILTDKNYDKALQNTFSLSPSLLFVERKIITIIIIIIKKPTLIVCKQMNVKKNILKSNINYAFIFSKNEFIVKYLFNYKINGF